MKKTFSYPIFFMALITAVFTFILAFLNYSTADKIAFLQKTELREKILYVFDIPVESSQAEDIAKVFDENVKEKDYKGKALYYIEENGETKAYAVPVEGGGVWGSIEAYVGISGDYDQILGLAFISHSETPGLGGRISEEEYKVQFRELDIKDSNSEKYLIYRPAAGGNVDAITGATGTSKAVVNFLNADIKEFIESGEGVK